MANLHDPYRTSSGPTVTGSFVHASARSDAIVVPIPYPVAPRPKLPGPLRNQPRPGQRAAKANPGSAEAVRAGCRRSSCPFDGRGGGGEPSFYVNGDCPMHGIAAGRAALRSGSRGGGRGKR